MTAAKPLRVLLTGARGQLGTAFQRSAPAGAEVVAFDHAQLDIRDRELVRTAVARVKPDLLVNAAAYTAVDAAEKHRELAFQVNADGAGHLAEAATRHAARLIHLSTDYVFDGARAAPYRPEDEPNPLNAYGASKLAGEVAVHDRTQGRALIVRTAWVYAAVGGNFVNTMLRLMHARADVRVVNDQFGSPTHAASLARAIWRFAALPAVRGIQHWTDAGVTSWFEFAQAIREAAARHAPAAALARLVPIPSSEYPTVARRPARAVLDTSGSQALVGAAAPWAEELERCLAEKAAG